MFQSLFLFFTDPILRAPTIGCMLMCLAASLVGVMVFLRKQSLIGEALSHAAYPGVIAGAVVAGGLSISDTDELSLSLMALGGAFATALLGLATIQFLERRFRVASDAALCFVLSSFFGIGLLMASDVQFRYTAVYKQILTYLYGQAATMTDVHIAIYGALVILLLIVIFIFYKELQLLLFDRVYAKSMGIPVKWIDGLLLFLVTIAVVIGIRSVGVVLMSAMLIAPVVTARQLTHRMPLLLGLAGCVGMLSGFIGNYASVNLTDWLSTLYPQSRMILPTGPMIVIVASSFCGIALLCAPDRGLLVRLLRVAMFRYACICENVLKTMWRTSPHERMQEKHILKYQSITPLYLKGLLWRMQRNGWVHRFSGGECQLTVDGRHRAEKIVRLHRLWEVYLVNYVGVGIERVHRNAEEMEHILTPEIEQELTVLLHDPKQDPHQQPIPSRKSLYSHDI